MGNFKTKSGAITHQEVMASVSRVSEQSRTIWSRAHAAVVEARHMRRATQAQVEELAADKEFRRRYCDAVLGKILRATIAGTNAGMGNIQLIERSTGRLLIHTQEGFSTPFLDYFQCVEPRHAACGTAMERERRVIVEDVTNSEIFRGDRSLEIILDAGVRAVQSTPLIGSHGQILGVLSTHHTVPFRQSEKNLRLIDYYARWAAAMIEWNDNGVKGMRSLP